MRVKTRCRDELNLVLTSLVAMVEVCLLIGIDRDFLDRGSGRVDGKVVWKVVQARYVVRSWDCSGKRLSEAGKLKSRSEMGWMIPHDSCSSNVPPRAGKLRPIAY